MKIAVKFEMVHILRLCRAVQLDGLSWPDTQYAKKIIRLAGEEAHYIAPIVFFVVRDYVNKIWPYFSAEKWDNQFAMYSLLNIEDLPLINFQARDGAEQPELREFVSLWLRDEQLSFLREFNLVATLGNLYEHNKQKYYELAEALENY